MRKCRLGDLMEFQRGYDLPKSKTISGKYKVITSNGTMAYHNKKKSGPSVVIGRSGTVGNPQLIEEEFWPHNTTLFVKDFKGNDIKYIYYLLLNLNIEKMKSGSNIPTLNRNHLHPLEIYAELDVDKQRKISKLLSKIDKKIEINNETNRELELMANVIYSYWFLQFDFPDENGKPYKLSGRKMVWNSILKKEIPEGWKVQNLKENDLTQILNPGIEKFNGNKIYLATGNVENNKIVSGNYITYDNRESRANMQPIENTVWFAKMKNSVKHIFVGEYSKSLVGNYIFSTGFLGLKCLDKKNFEYINCYINSDFFEVQKDKLAHGATQEAVNNNDIRLIPLIIPDNIVLEKFHEKTNNIFRKIYLNNIENEELNNLRDFLNPLLMNGQVKL